MDYLLLLLTAVAFELAYVAWARAAVSQRVHVTAACSTATAALGLYGLKGALDLQYGGIVYLVGIALGAYSSAYLQRSGH